MKKYKELSLNEIKNIVVFDKWIDVLRKELEQLLDDVSQVLSSFIINLAKRYETTLTSIEADVRVLEGKVEEHLRRMGYKW